MEEARKYCTRLLCLLLWLLVIGLCVSCSSGKAVIVPEVRQVVVHERDTVMFRDSVKMSSTTIVQQADSALLAEFGIRLDNMEKAWLVRQSTNKESASHSASTSRKDSIVHDSIPVPYPQVVYKDKKLTRWQTLKMELGFTLIMVVLTYIGMFIFEKITKKKIL